MNLNRSLVAVALAIAVFIPVGCDRKPADPTPQSPQIEAPREVAAPSTRTASPEFIRLAAAVATALAEERVQGNDTTDVSSAIAAAHQRIIDLRKAAASGGDIAYVAQLAEQAITELLRAEEQTRVEVSAQFDDAAIVGLIGLVLGEPTTILGALSQAESANRQIDHLNALWEAALTRHKAAQLLLPGLANTEIHGPPGPWSIGLDFDENWATGDLGDVLSMSNNSGKDLTNCMLRIEYLAGNGDRAVNVHFVPIWPAGAVRFGLYGLVFDESEESEFAQSVTGVRTIRASLWSDQLKASTEYTYVGKERDKEYQRLADQMKWSWRYWPAEKPGFLSAGTVQTLELTMSGPSVIPEHTINLTFRNGSQTYGRSWTFPYRIGGRPQIFAPQGGFPFEPTQVEVVATFPESEVRSSTTIDLRARR